MPLPLPLIGALATAAGAATIGMAAVELNEYKKLRDYKKTDEYKKRYAPPRSASASAEKPEE